MSKTKPNEKSSLFNLREERFLISYENIILVEEVLEKTKSRRFQILHEAINSLRKEIKERFGTESLDEIDDEQFKKWFSRKS